MAQFVGPRRTRRTNRRLARIRLHNPNALGGVKADSKYTPREVRKVRRLDRTIRAKDRVAAQKKAAQAKRPKPYDPLAPLTGKRETQEENAAVRLQYGPKERELRTAQRSQEQTTANTGTYYDDWKKALGDATERIRGENAANVKATEDRVDASFRGDSAALQQRNAEAAARAAVQGAGPQDSKEGAQAVSAQRSQGNQSAAELRNRSSSDDKFMELRGANAVLAKAQALAREHGKAAKLQADAVALKGDEGATRVDVRRKNRSDERTWAATQKEFGLKQQDLNIKARGSKAQQKIDSQKIATQKIVARLYAGSNRAKARAQIRVAKLQLQKGKIDQHQYRQIVNIYKGLPKKGKSGGAGNGSSKPGGGGVGSGTGGSLAPWERDKVTNATHILSKNHASVTDRAKWMKAMQDEGVPSRLARVAWRHYVNSRQHAAGSNPGGPRGTGTL